MKRFLWPVGVCPRREMSCPRVPKVDDIWVGSMADHLHDRLASYEVGPALRPDSAGIIPSPTPTHSGFWCFNQYHGLDSGRFAPEAQRYQELAHANLVLDKYRGIIAACIPQVLDTFSQVWITPTNNGKESFTMLTLDSAEKSVSRSASGRSTSPAHFRHDSDCPTASKVCPCVLANPPWGKLDLDHSLTER